MKKSFLTLALVLFAFPLAGKSLRAVQVCNNDSQCGKIDRGIQNICFKGLCWRGCHTTFDCSGRAICNRGRFCTGLLG